MNVPIFTRQIFVNKDGNLSDAVQQFFDVLIQQMQENLSNDGLVVPSLTTDQINNVANTSNANAKPNGTLWYDTDTNQLKFLKNGVVTVIA